MVSMVITLFLVAVLISLFAGRLAEVVLGKIRERAESRKRDLGAARPATDAMDDKAA
jgi:hypothetical protein